MRFAWVVCLKDLRLRLRDRTALLVAVVVPLVLSTLVGLALGSNDAAMELRLALVDRDGGPDSDAFRRSLARPWLEGVILIEEVASWEEAAELLEDDGADAALILQRNFASAALAGDAFAAAPGHASEGPPPIEVLASGQNPFATRMVVALAERFLSDQQRQAEGREPPAPMHVMSPSGELRPMDFYALSMTVLFLTFTVLSGVRAIQEEIDAGAMARLAASPASPKSILAGKLLALMLIGLLQVAVMIAATSLLFGTDWGNPLPVLALTVATVTMAIGMTAFFMSAAQNAVQGQMLASISIFLLAIVGGQFMPAQGLPDVFDTLQRLTPNGQAARGFMDIAAAGANGTLGTVIEPLLFTSIVGLAGIGFAARRSGSVLEDSR